MAVKKAEPKESYIVCGLDVWWNNYEYPPSVYKVGDGVNRWQLILEEDERFRVLRDKKDGVREVVVLPKSTLSHWKLYAKKAD